MKFQLLLYCTLFYVNIGLCLLTTYLDMLFSRFRGEAPGLGALARCAPSVPSHHGWETALLVGCGGCGVWGRQQGHREPLPALVQALPHHRARPEPGAACSGSPRGREGSPGKLHSPSSLWHRGVPCPPPRHGSGVGQRGWGGTVPPAGLTPLPQAHQTPSTLFL